MKVLKYIILFTLGMIGTTWAGSMTFSPSNESYGMHCWNSGTVYIDTNGVSVSAIDSKIFFTDIVMSGFAPLLVAGNYEQVGALGYSLKTATYPWNIYLSGTPYAYVNRYANGLDSLLNTGADLFSFLFASTGALSVAGDLDFYYLWDNNYDDSNMQSGIVNGMADVLDSINSGYYTFIPRPCIVDTDPPLFTGYSSGAVYSSDTDSGFYFTIYDYTGANIIGNNTTEHYWFQSLPANGFNLTNYIPVIPGSGIDNQYGVNSGSISVFLSGIIEIVSGNLLTGVLITGVDCSLTYSGEGFPLTWNQNSRGYTCFVPFSGLNFEISQTVLVVITGADNPNFLNGVNTGSVSFSFDYLESGKMFDITVYPGSRPGLNFTNIGELRFYDLSNTLIASGSVSTNESGVGTLFLQVPPGDYNAVYKGQSHLASYLSGVSIPGGGAFPIDFTTGSNLFNTQNKSISQDDGSQYQIAGDLKNILGIYDFTVNGNDIAILTISGFIDGGIDILDPNNLNADTAINVSDIAVIGINFELTDPYFENTSFTW